MVLKGILNEEAERDSEDDVEIFGRLASNGLQGIAIQGFRELTKLQIQNFVFSAQFTNHTQQLMSSLGIPFLQNHEMEFPGTL